MTNNAKIGVNLVFAAPLILADDFSGACDAAARAGVYSSAALLDPSAAAETDLVAFSTETRHASPEEARARLRSWQPFLAGRPLYKKIDSTLRGPWIDEVDELLHITDYSQAVVCPAFPALGRTVRNGWLRVDDQPVQKITCPFTVRDASSEDDLASIAAEICSSILPVGSAGLALHVFRRLARSASIPLAPSPGPWLVLVGSDHPASQAQLQFLRNARLPDVLINPGADPPAPAGIFATGGETAARFLRRAGARGITSLRELLPGVPAGLLIGGRYNGAVMITKAGSFGSPDTLLRALGLFR